MSSKNRLQEAMKKRTEAAKPKSIKPADIYAVEEPKPETPKEVEKAEEPKKKEVKQLKKAKLTEDELVNYATYVYSRQKKKVKIHAIERGVLDQEIVREALDEYFENHPL